jgi:hypothetical protein
MKNPLYCKILAVGIIVLFMGVSVTSAIRVENKTHIIDNQVEDDCSCNEVSDADIVKLEKQLDRVERYCKLVLVSSRYNPELKRTSDDLFDRIPSLNALILTNLICGILESILKTINSTLQPFFELRDKYLENDNKILANMTLIIIYPIAGIAFKIWKIAYKYGCLWVT